MSRRDRRRNPLGEFAGYRNFRGPTPPHDYCMSCGRGDSTRMIIIASFDVEWLEVALSVVLDHDEDMISGELARNLAEIVWREMDPKPDGRVWYRVRLCRACANHAVDQFAHPPKIYAFNRRFEAGESILGVTQPEPGEVA